MLFQVPVDTLQVHFRIDLKAEILRSICVVYSGNKDVEIVTIKDAVYFILIE